MIGKSIEILKSLVYSLECKVVLPSSAVSYMSEMVELEENIMR